MKILLPIALASAALTFAACDAKVNTAPAEKKETTVVTPAGGGKTENNTTVVNPPASSTKTETNTTVTPK